MANKSRPFNLSTDELRSLTTLLSSGTTKARTQTRARVLDLLHRRHLPDQVATTLHVSAATVFNLKRRFLAEGLDAALRVTLLLC